MKKIIIVLLLFTFFFKCKLNSSFYFDLGAGYGFLSKIYEYAPYNVESLTKDLVVTRSGVVDNYNFDLKLGYLISNKLGVSTSMNIFIIRTYNLKPRFNNDLEFTINQPFVTIHLTESSHGFINQDIGLIYYVSPRIQTSLSVGYGMLAKEREIVLIDDFYTEHNPSLPDYRVYGTSYDFTVAYDIPWGKIGALVGFRFFYSSGSKTDSMDYGFYEVSSIGIFSKIRLLNRKGVINEV